jgi:hypothetical protein
MALIIFSDSSCRSSQTVKSREIRNANPANGFQQVADPKFVKGSDVAAFQIHTPSPACRRILNTDWVLFHAGPDRRTDLVHPLYE